LFAPRPVDVDRDRTVEVASIVIHRKPEPAAPALAAALVFGAI
jgi:hypothetical protein